MDTIVYAGRIKDREMQYCVLLIAMNIIKQSSDSYIVLKNETNPVDQCICKVIPEVLGKMHLHG